MMNMMNQYESCGSGELLGFVEKLAMQHFPNFHREVMTIAYACIGCIGRRDKRRLRVIAEFTSSSRFGRAAAARICSASSCRAKETLQPLRRCLAKGYLCQVLIENSHYELYITYI